MAKRWRGIASFLGHFAGTVPRGTRLIIRHREMPDFGYGVRAGAKLLAYHGGVDVFAGLKTTGLIVVGNPYDQGTSGREIAECQSVLGKFHSRILIRTEGDLEVPFVSLSLGGQELLKCR